MKNLFTCIALIFLFLVPATASGESKQPDRRESGRQQNREQAVQQRREQTNRQPSRVPTGNHRNAKPGTPETAVATARSRAAESRALTDIPFTQITLPYSQTAAAFNPVAELGGNYCYVPLKFTLSAASEVRFSGYNYDAGWGPYFDLYDGNMNPIVEYEWFNGYMGGLPAGTYYLLINDDGYKDNYGETYACDLSISAVNWNNIPFTQITLPYSQTAAAFNPVAELGGNYCYVPLKFTLSAAAPIRFAGYNPDADWGPCFDLFDGDMNRIQSDGWFDGYSSILPVGTYYLLVNDDGYKADYGETYTCDLSISAVNWNDIPFTQITLPYSQTAAAFNPVEELGGNYCYVPLKFTLSAAATIHFSGYNDDADWGPCFDLFDGNMNWIQSDGWFDGYTKLLPSGTYYLLVNDDSYKADYGETYTCNLSISATDIPFTQITLPYSQTAAAFNPVAGLYDDLCYVLLKFTLSADAVISFAGYNYDAGWSPGFDLLDGNMNLIKSAGWFDSYWMTLPSGTYYLLVNDDGYKSGHGETYTCDLSISAGSISVDPAAAPDNAVKAYASGRTVYVEDAAPGSLLSFFDVAGRLLMQKAATSDRESYTVDRPGVYLVRVQNEVFKVICR